MRCASQRFSERAVTTENGKRLLSSGMRLFEAHRLRGLLACAQMVLAFVVVPALHPALHGPGAHLGLRHERPSGRDEREFAADGEDDGRSHECPVCAFQGTSGAADGSFATVRVSAPEEAYASQTPDDVFGRADDGCVGRQRAPPSCTVG